MRYAHEQKIGTPNNIKVFWSKKTKRPKQDSQYRLRSPTEKGEP